MAVYDPDEVVIPNKLWMGDVRIIMKHVLFDDITLHAYTCSARTIHGRDVSEGSLCTLWFPLGVCKVGAGQADRVSRH